MDIPAKEVMQGADPGKRLLDEGLIRGNKLSTKQAVDTALGDAGKKLDTALTNMSRTGSQAMIDGETLVQDATKAAIKKIGRPREATFQANLNGIEQDILDRFPNLDSLTPKEAHSLKVDLGDAINWKGAAYDDPINQVKIQIYRDLNKAIKQKVPGIADLQDRWGDLYIASKNLKESLAEDVVGKGSGAAIPNAAQSPAMKAAKIGLKYSPLAGGGLGLGYGIYRDLTKP
jgi:hypothetical protein